MKKYFLPLLLTLCFGSVSLFAQEDYAKKYAALITQDDLRQNLTIIASDAMEGRYTGSRGQKMAAAFIQYEFEKAGLQAPVDGSYLMPVNLYQSSLSDCWVKVNDTQYTNHKDFVYLGNGIPQHLTLPLVYVGNATEEELSYLNIKDQAVVMTVKVEKEIQPLISSAFKAARSLFDKGAKLVFVNSNLQEGQFENLVSLIQQYTGDGVMSLTPPGTSSEPSQDICFLNSNILEKWLGMTAAKLEKLQGMPARKKPLKKISPPSITYHTSVNTQNIKSENVLGYMEGTDKKDELLVITAHYDHIGLEAEGLDRINNGADDDGSGTVAVLQMMKAFTQAKKDGHGPRRSILFMTVTGEEEGLFGSQYYVENPVYPLQNTVVNLNIDMIGRWDPQHKAGKEYVYVIGSDKLSSELHLINENVNAIYTKLDFDYTYNDEHHPDRLYQRSDHWNFAKNNIPIIFYFDGIHEDYHKVTDEVSKIDFDILANRTRLIFHTAWEIANRENRISIDEWVKEN